MEAEIFNLFRGVIALVIIGAIIWFIIQVIAWIGDQFNL